MNWGILHAGLELEFSNSNEMAMHARTTEDAYKFRARADLCLMFSTILGPALTAEEGEASEAHKAAYSSSWKRSRAGQNDQILRSTVR